MKVSSAFFLTGALLAIHSFSAVAYAEVSEQSDSSDSLSLPDLSNARYWGEKRRVGVVQRRQHLKEGRYELGLFGGVIPNDPFVPYAAFGLRFAYFISEAFSVEGTYSKPLENRTDLELRLRQRYEGKFYHVQVNDIMTHKAHVNMAWTPIVGKTSVMGRRHSTFDLGFSMGAGWLLATYRHPGTAKTGTRTTPLGGMDIPGTPEGNLGVSFRFFIYDWLAVRTDVNQYFFAKAMGGLSHPTMVSLGMSTLLPVQAR